MRVKELSQNSAGGDVTELETILADAQQHAMELFNRRSALSVRQKGPDQLVCEADLLVEKRLRRLLAQYFPDEPILGEEFGGAMGGDGWVIDPIDGTSNFVRGLPLWGISVGLMRNGRPILGGVALPALAVTLCAAAGGGLRLNGRPFGRPSPPAYAVTYALGENAYWPDAEREAAADRLRRQGFDVVRYRSASVALTLSALGQLDGYVEVGLRLWDIAAGWLLCEEAGLQVQVDSLGDDRMTINVSG